MTVRATVVGAMALFLVGCGSAGSSSSTSTSSSGGAQQRQGVSGELVQIQGSNLVVTNSSGDTSVVLSSTTTIAKQQSASLSDLSVGTCVVATGAKDATTGVLTATRLQLRPAVNGSCTVTGPGAGGGPRPSRSPGSLPASAAPSPSGTPLPRGAFAAGLLTAINGRTLTLHSGSTDTTVTVAPTATMTLTATVPASTLATNLCVTVTGPKGSDGTVQARQITIVPAGPSGCSSNPGGGFGGGRRGGGGGSFGSGGGGTPATDGSTPTQGA